jgi:hypothetical protein
MALSHSVPMSAKKFTEADRLKSLQYYSPDVWPGLYSDLPNGMRFVGRVLIKIKDIELDIGIDADDKEFHNNFFVSQSGAIRIYGVGENADDVKASLNEHGYELSHVPMSVAKIHGKQMILDGRTRLWALKEAGFENVIVDLYEIDEWKVYYSEGLRRNPRPRPSSPMTKAEVINNCNYRIQNGWLKREWSAIIDYVNDVTDKSFKPEVCKKIAHNVMFGIGYSASVISFGKDSATAWLKRNGYIDNVNNNGIYYEVFASSAYSKAVAGAASKMLELENEGKTVKELRIVIHTGTLEGSNPIISWEDAVDSFRQGWKNDLNNIGKYFFGTTDLVSRIKLYGVIPAVQQLAELYPMDKLVMFHIGNLKTKSFSEIRTENSLDDSLLAA